MSARRLFSTAAARNARRGAPPSSTDGGGAVNPYLRTSQNAHAPSGSHHGIAAQHARSSHDRAAANTPTATSSAAAPATPSTATSFSASLQQNKYLLPLEYMHIGPVAHQTRMKEMSAQGRFSNHRERVKQRWHEAIWVDEAAQQLTIDERLNTMRGRVVFVDPETNSLKVRLYGYVSDVEKRLLQYTVEEGGRSPPGADAGTATVSGGTTSPDESRHNSSTAAAGRLSSATEAGARTETSGDMQTGAPVTRTAENEDGDRQVRGGQLVALRPQQLGRIVAQSRLRETRSLDARAFGGKVTSSGHARTQEGKVGKRGEIEKIQVRVWHQSEEWRSFVSRLEETTVAARKRAEQMRELLEAATAKKKDEAAEVGADPFFASGEEAAGTTASKTPSVTDAQERLKLFEKAAAAFIEKQTAAAPTAAGSALESLQQAKAGEEAATSATGADWRSTSTAGGRTQHQATVSSTITEETALQRLADHSAVQIRLPRNLTPSGAVLLDVIANEKPANTITLWLEGVGDCGHLKGRKDVLVDFVVPRGQWRKRHIAIDCAPDDWHVGRDRLRNAGPTAGDGAGPVGKTEATEDAAAASADRREDLGQRVGPADGTTAAAEVEQDPENAGLSDLERYEQLQVRRKVVLSKEQTAAALCPDLRACLNPEQLEVVQGVLSADCSFGNPMLVWGPPGTGKSFTLLCALWKVLKHLPDVKVLVCAPSNKAADLLLVGLAKKIGLKPEDLIRVNSRARQHYMLGPVDVDTYRDLETHFPEIPEMLNPEQPSEDELAQKEECIRHSMMLQYSTCDSYDIRPSHRVLVTTATAAGNLPTFFDSPAKKALCPVVFVPDLVLVDEAGQCTEPDAYVPLALNPRRARVVLCGDHKQLRPTVLEQQAELLQLNISMLERLASERIRAEHRRREQMRLNPAAAYQLKKAILEGRREAVNEKIYFLTKTFRSHPDLTSLWNVFYGNLLKPMSDREKTVMRFRATKQPALFHDLAFEGEAHKEEKVALSFINQLEAHLVCEYILHEVCVEGGVKTKDVGVITFYDAQVKWIQQKLMNLSESGEVYLGDIEVGTAEYFQGSEKRVIIISCVRTEAIGFLKDEKRLNVALSRAQDGMVVIGAFANLLAQDPHWNSVLTVAKKMGCVVSGSS